MSSCSVMIPILSAMSCRDIGGGGGPPQRDSNLQPLPNNRSVQSARRKLFDVDHDQTSRDLERELRQCEERDRNKYNFDFVNERPIHRPDSQYEWSQIGHDFDDTDRNDAKLSTKCKFSDDLVTANPSQSLSASPSSKTSSTTMSSDMVQKSRPTSATISTDCQSIASSSVVQLAVRTGHDANQSTSRVKSSTQPKITEFLVLRKSAQSEGKRSANLSHKDRQSKRQRREPTVGGEDTDTSSGSGEESVQQTTGTAV